MFLLNVDVTIVCVVSLYSLNFYFSMCQEYTYIRYIWTDRELLPSLTSYMHLKQYLFHLIICSVCVREEGREGVMERLGE